MTPSRQARLHAIRQRVHTPDTMYSYCRVKGCPHPTRAATSNGLDMLYCAKHAEHRQRHGSVWKTSYRNLRRYHRTALTWLHNNAAHPAIVEALLRIRKLYACAGPSVPAHNLRGLKPQQRAWIALARLREARIAPERVLTACLTVEMAQRDDDHPELTSPQEYRLVQLAKAVHRLASGTHRRWTKTVTSTTAYGFPLTRTLTQRLDMYPSSKGRILRHLGQKLETVLAPLHQAGLLP